MFEGISKENASEILSEAKMILERYRSKDLILNMSRGKPCPEQIDLSSELFFSVNPDDCIGEEGVDCRNYGELSGIIEMKRVFSEILDIPVDKICIGGNSSLDLMFNTFSRAYTKGLPDSEKPWSKYDSIKFLCPVPGYDRHFAVSEYYGMEMINIPMLKTGPDMIMVENLVKENPSIKGIWCVPVFSNPDGCVYSDDTVERLAKMECAAKDFTIMWDASYKVHSLYDEEIEIANILEECEKYGNSNRALIFASTSKITHAGAGVVCIGGSKESIKAYLKTATISTIGYDKINMLRHARFLKNKAGVLSKMKKHAEILLPKFEMVNEIFSRNLDRYNIAGWTNPRGGYFISMNVFPGTAKRVYSLCKEAGVTLTSPGATFPYGYDPEDSNIRIAPTFPSVTELSDACEIISMAVIITAAEVYLNS